MVDRSAHPEPCVEISAWLVGLLTGLARISVRLAPRFCPVAAAPASMTSRSRSRRRQLAEWRAGVAVRVGGLG